MAAAAARTFRTVADECGGGRDAAPARVTAREVIALCFDLSERAKWAVLKSFPHVAPWRSIDDLTDEEQTWVTVMRAIDEGLSLCAWCGECGYGAFCGACGREHAAATECPACHTFGVRAHCTQCGARLQNSQSIIRDLVAGRRTYEELDALTRLGHGPGEDAAYRAWLEESVGRFEAAIPPESDSGEVTDG